MKRTLDRVLDQPDSACAQVEAAYDMLFMQSMKRRLSGEGVSSNIRFADVARRKPAKQACPALPALCRLACM